MKTIKENSLLDSVPESITIQNVINALYPTLFSTKCAAKYFLTVLGDNMLRKNNNHIHYVPLYSKTFITATWRHENINHRRLRIRRFKFGRVI